jgi:hypothetical protein
MSGLYQTWLGGVRYWTGWRDRYERAYANWPFLRSRTRIALEPAQMVHAASCSGFLTANPMDSRDDVSTIRVWCRSNLRPRASPAWVYAFAWREEVLFPESLMIVDSGGFCCSDVRAVRLSDRRRLADIGPCVWVQCRCMIALALPMWPRKLGGDIIGRCLSLRDLEFPSVGREGSRLGEDIGRIVWRGAERFQLTGFAGPLPHRPWRIRCGRIRSAVCPAALALH